MTSGYKVSIILSCVFSVTTDAVLATIFLILLRRIYKVSGGQYNRLIAIIWLIIISSICHIFSELLMAAIYWIDGKSKAADMKVNVPVSLLAF